jgi:hypothetical protein
VRVDEELRVEGEDRRPARAGLGLRAPDPVAVHVEEVVVAAPVRPAPAAHGVRVEVRDVAGTLLELREDALAPVGVEAGIDDDDDVFQEVGDVRARARRGGWTIAVKGARGLAVDVGVAEPRDGGEP